MWRNQRVEDVDWLRQFSTQFLSTTRDSMDRAHAKLEAQPGVIDVLVSIWYGRFGVVNTRSLGFGYVGGLELLKLVYLRIDHGLGTIFKKSSERSTYFVGFVSDERTNTNENKTLQFVKGLMIELQRALAPLPPMGFTTAVEASKQMKMADQTIIQRKVATSPATPPYKRPG
ncbi:hypothetical protein M9H77_14362 [Catharanthus roseus]|uniref:Uncharacterized protein n=1 Tax=Catharanthus roseus TaxID=4058 RepID=A0ACC0BN09_CATRO|nr:hypothetical protein M9H77_14362 [Catharanthus roseus]